MSIQFFEPKEKYLTFKSFKNIKPLIGSHPQDARAQFIAQEVINSKTMNNTYSDDWFILMREGKWGAEVEKAVSLLHQRFLGYGTDINILFDKEQNAYFWVLTLMCVGLPCSYLLGVKLHFDIIGIMFASNMALALNCFILWKRWQNCLAAKPPELILSAT